MRDENRKPDNGKVTQVFKFLKELSVRNPPNLDINKYEWSLYLEDLSSLPGIDISWINEKFSAGEYVFRITKSKESSCPEYPQELEGWVSGDWQSVDGNVEHLKFKNIQNDENKTTSLAFEDFPTLGNMFNKWCTQRDNWIAAEVPVRKANAIFAKFFSLNGMIERESEKFQLYLADGFLKWTTNGGTVTHPILLKKVELEFFPKVPEFRIVDTDEKTFLFSELFRFLELDGLGIKYIKGILEDGPEVHPLDLSKSREFINLFANRIFTNSVVHQNSNFDASETPGFYQKPLFFLGNKVHGFADVMDKLIESLPTFPNLPEALLRVVGTDLKVGELVGDHASEIRQKSEDEFLFTKPSNLDQKRIVKNLDRSGSVLVQGPPGTGKTHTIANIIGHYLAKGQTILVTSHTNKSLRVLREKVVRPLQPLCVAVLDKDTESKAQLKESIEGIINYTSKTDTNTLTIEISELNKKRMHLKEKLNYLENKALQIKKNEYTDIVFNGKSIAPSQAAREIAEKHSVHGWIPLPVKIGAPIPLDLTEFDTLYRSNSISLTEEKCFDEELPDLKDALSPDQFKENIELILRIDRKESALFFDYWKNSDRFEVGDYPNVLEKQIENIRSNTWLKKISESSFLSDEKREIWSNLISTIKEASAEINLKTELIYIFGPKCEGGYTPADMAISVEILEYLKLNSSLSSFKLLLNPKWKAFLSKCSVDNGRPASLEHFQAIYGLLRINQLRSELFNRWERQVVSIGGPSIEIDRFEEIAPLYLSQIQECINWKSEVWKKNTDLWEALGFDSKRALSEYGKSNGNKSFVDQFLAVAAEIVIPAIKSRQIWFQLNDSEREIKKTFDLVKNFSGRKENYDAYLSGILEAIKTSDPGLYKQSFEKFFSIKGKESLYRHRLIFLGKLRNVAPVWANKIANRDENFSKCEVPQEIELAWTIAQWKCELDKRNEENPGKVSEEIRRVKNEQQIVNAAYIEKLAWKFQIERTGLKEQQALSGWHQIQNRITQTGRGVRDAVLIKTAREQLKQCKNAVPVWIMPLKKVFESYDFTRPMFDILILDEASQSDLQALAAFALAKKVIVVGDDQQVTPLAIGQELNQVQTLIDEHLTGIPNKQLYEGKTSIYDLAAQSFGEIIRLVEHFRCVPDIINFSNNLSYRGTIKPLREASTGRFISQVIDHRVNGNEVGKINEVEATEIASLILAMTETKEYEDSSIGVISLFGPEQALYIDNILQKRMPTEKYVKHKILCGNSPQFQGDERRVIFLSMVWSASEPPLRMVQNEVFKKTLNVAVSRAQDQLWVVNSLNPETDLQPGDLRLRLLQHARNPNDLENEIKQTQDKADPKSVVFEQGVIADLMREGFKVSPQVRVGSYTLDIVMEPRSMRVAIECDGDRFHTSENLAADIQRQEVLERLEWKILRIRGSDYFRNKKMSIDRIAKELEELGIERLGNAPKVGDASNYTDPLKEKILKLAFEIRQNWRNESENSVLEKDFHRKKTKQKNSSAKVFGNSAVAVKPSLELDEQERTNTIFERLNKQHSTSDHLISDDLQPQEVAAIVLESEQGIIEKVKSRNINFVDHRMKGGAFWILGGVELESVVKDFAKSGMYFIFLEKGSRATGFSPGWYSKNAK